MGQAIHRDRTVPSRYPILPLRPETHIHLTRGGIFHHSTGRPRHHLSAYLL